PREACVHELFEAQAARTPAATAVVQDGRRLTYAELNAQANRLAHYLRRLGVGPDARVAVCLDRSPELVTALLAVLKAGGAYAPLDPSYPAERLSYMLRDSSPVVVLTGPGGAHRIAGLLDGSPALASLRTIDLVADAELWARDADADPQPAAVGLQPRHLAYVIYTSGSTGQPKGVMVEH
ncbi:AMP-binding protein, partial [Methylosinus sp. Sm6]|uniref:AMP-binding protein n=1 Tax=Methylosinus sp. Sm6 TaxID=2866948 RepID=UPI001C999634